MVWEPFANNVEYVRVSRSKRSDAWFWAQDNGINIEYAGNTTNKDFWRIPNEKDRVAFTLRWA